jgi:hypothetical protein
MEYWKIWKIFLDNTSTDTNQVAGTDFRDGVNIVSGSWDRGLSTFNDYGDPGGPQTGVNSPASFVLQVDASQHVAQIPEPAAYFLFVAGSVFSFYRLPNNSLRNAC